MRLTPALLHLILSACAQFPQVDAVSGEGTTLVTPALLPVEDLLIGPLGQAEARGAVLAARAAALRARLR